VDIQLRGDNLVVVACVLLVSLALQGSRRIGRGPLFHLAGIGRVGAGCDVPVYGERHLTKTREDLIGMVPKAFPNPRFLMHLTGVLEVLGAVGLLVPATRSVAGLALLLVAMFPANANASRKEVELLGKAPTPLWLRTPMQLLFIGMTLWVALP